MKIVFKRTLLILLVEFLTAMLLVGQAASGESSGNSDTVRLQILTVNDFHGALMEKGKDPGAAKLVEYLKEAKTQDPDGTILVSAGDMFEGTADSNLLYGETVVDIM